MPESWLYVAGGIIIGMLVFTISYHLVSVSIIQAQKQNALSDFNTLCSDVESVCRREIGNSMRIRLRVPNSIRVVYATNKKGVLSTVVDKIKNKEESNGFFLCLQFKDEQTIRCRELSCSVSIPYIGALETYNDIQLMINKILGRPMIKEYPLLLEKTEIGVNATIVRCKEKGEKCDSSQDCCGWVPYCWDDTSPDALTCHEECADNGNYASDRLSCCSGYLNNERKCNPLNTITSTTVPETTTTSKLGFQTQFQKPGVMNFIETAHPAVVKLMGDFGKASEIKQKSPHTFIVGRIFDPNQPMDGDPEQRAQEWFNKNKGTIEANPSVDCWEGYNEPYVPDSTSMQWLSRFEIKRMQLLEGIGGRACIGSFSTGNPDLSLWSSFMDALNYATQHGHYLSLHEYDYPRMDSHFDHGSGEGWLIGRYRKVYRQYGLSLPLVITETGIDSGGCPDDCGWRAHTDVNDYLEQLKWYDSILKEDNYVIGATIFHYGLFDWQSFEIYPDLTGETGVEGPLVTYIKQS